MIKVVPIDAAGKPARWTLCFEKSSPSRWVRLLACGRYKHVRAFGYVAEADAWVFFDLRFRQIDIWTARGAGARYLMAHYVKDCDLVQMPAAPDRGSTFRAGFWCVPAIKHLIGLRSGALRPDTLYRHCVIEGGEVIADEPHSAEPAVLPASASRSAPATG